MTINFLMLLLLSLAAVAAATVGDEGQDFSTTRNLRRVSPGANANLDPESVDIATLAHRRHQSHQYQRRRLASSTFLSEQATQKTCSRLAPPCPATDYVFIMDESGTIDRREFRKMQDFVRAIVGRIPDNGNTRIGIVEFDQDTEVVLELESNRTKVNTAVDDLVIYPGGYTETDEAVFKAIDMLSDASRNRVMILLTDGMPNAPNCANFSICDPAACGGGRYVGDAIENFKTASSTKEGLVILIGIGGIVNHRTDCLATSEDTIYEGDTFDDLPEIEERLTNADLLCLNNEPPQFECQDIELVVERADGEVTIEPEDIVVGGIIFDPENATLTVTLDANTFYVDIHGGTTVTVTLFVGDGENDCSCTAEVSVMVPPTGAPSSSPTTSVSPSVEPSAIPTISSVPSITPTTFPSSIPSITPTLSSAPSVTPTSLPSISPTTRVQPSAEPGDTLTNSPVQNGLPDQFETPSVGFPTPPLDAPVESPSESPVESPEAVPIESPSLAPTGKKGGKGGKGEDGAGKKGVDVSGKKHSGKGGDDSGKKGEEDSGKGKGKKGGSDFEIKGEDEGKKGKYCDW